MKSNNLIKVFDVFQDSEKYYENINQRNKYTSLIGNQLLIIAIFALLYGVIMGSYNGYLQALVTGIKLPVLFILVLFICFPAFYIIQFVLGSKLKLLQILAIILSGFVITNTIMLSFSPIVVFFMITGNNYAFLKLLHVGIMAVSGIFGMMSVLRAIKISCESKNIYPKTGVVIFRFWVLVMAFVGMQLAWNLRPFLGDKGAEFQLFREKEGNIYLAIIDSMSDL